MEHEDPIENETEPALEPPAGKDEIEVIEKSAKSPWKAFILTGFLAGLLGAALGGGGLYAALKTVAPQSAATQTVDLSPLEAKLSRLSDRVKTAESDLKSRAAVTAPEFEPTDLSDVEARLAALERAPRPDINPEALTALKSAQDDGFEWPDVSDLEARIAALESETQARETRATEVKASESEAKGETDVPAGIRERLTALENNFEDLKTSSSGALEAVERLSAVEVRLKAFENRPPPEPVVERVSILAFPKDALIEAADKTQEGNILEKTLSRHIRVKDANDPLTLIEGIEKDLSAGALTSALEKFERLPAPVKAAGQAWSESVRASL